MGNTIYGLGLFNNGANWFDDSFAADNLITKDEMLYFAENHGNDSLITEEQKLTFAFDELKKLLVNSQNAQNQANPLDQQDTALSHFNNHVLLTADLATYTAQLTSDASYIAPHVETAQNQTPVVVKISFRKYR